MDKSNNNTIKSDPSKVPLKPNTVNPYLEVIYGKSERAKEIADMTIPQISEIERERRKRLGYTIKLQSEEEIISFLWLLNENYGKIAPAAAKMGMTRYPVDRLLSQYDNFRAAVQAIQADHRQAIRDELEDISENNARDPKSVVERIFQLKALDPEKYNPRRKDTPPPNIHIKTTSINIDNRKSAKDLEVDMSDLPLSDSGKDRDSNDLGKSVYPSGYVRAETIRGQHTVTQADREMSSDPTSGESSKSLRHGKLVHVEEDKPTQIRAKELDVNDEDGDI